MTTCMYCDKETKQGEPIFGLTLAIQSDAGFDTIVIKKFCSYACKARYRDRIKQEIEQSPRFRLGEFETKMKAGT